MQVIGFVFTKIMAERLPTFKKLSGTSLNVEFIELEKEEIALLEKKEPIKITFRASVTYENKEEKKPQKEAEILFEGHLILSAEKDESKDILKAWKKKELPNSFKVPLFNIILKRCTVKALQLEEEIGLPTHLPIPQLTPAPQQQKQEE